MKDGYSLREMRCTLGVWRNVDGSASFSQGATSVCASCSGPGDVHASRVDDEKMVFEVSYRQSTGENKFHTLNKILTTILNKVASPELFPRTALTVTMHGLQDDGSIDAAAVNAMCFAMLGNGLPIRTVFCGVKVVRVDEKLIVDPTLREERKADALYFITMQRNAQSKEQAEVLTMDCTGPSEPSEIKDAVQLAQQAALSIFDFYRSIVSQKILVDEPE